MMRLCNPPDRYNEQLMFRDTKAVRAIILRLAEKDGLMEAPFLRMILRIYLRTREDLTNQERVALKLEPNSKELKHQ